MIVKNNHLPKINNAAYVTPMKKSFTEIFVVMIEYAEYQAVSLIVWDKLFYLG